MLSQAFQKQGYEVIVVSRHPNRTSWRTVQRDAQTLGDWTAELEGADAVINLAERSVSFRYNAENRRLIMDSRVQSTQILGEVIARATRPPRIWLQASTATIYAHRSMPPQLKADDHLIVDVNRINRIIK
jgi:uncharacterized protein